MEQAGNQARVLSASVSAADASGADAAAGQLESFCNVRAHTEAICARLEIEDHVVQPAPFVSPPKWHLAHSTWFFDRFLLQPAGREEASLPPARNLLFNSYYKGQGQHWLQEQRGHLSRPTVQAILDYRHALTEQVTGLLQRDEVSAREREIIEIGLHHEQQHQELLLMDIKYIFAQHPGSVAYDDCSRPVPISGRTPPPRWLGFSEGMCEVGMAAPGFAFDNEKPRHPRWQPGFQLCDRLASNEDYLAFMEDGGYQRAELWLSDGWEWVRQGRISHPLYWREQEQGWQEYHLAGWHDLQADLPVSHVSYFEADAYARWREARLPTEFELEVFVAQTQEPAAQAFWLPGRSLCPVTGRAADTRGNGLLWQWTQSPYVPYPGFAPQAGALGEYNGKFMCNQQVLRGGCVATPRHHLRPSYRNFYRAHDRWCFCGIRLVRQL